MRSLSTALAVLLIPVLAGCDDEDRRSEDAQAAPTEAVACATDLTLTTVGSEPVVLKEAGAVSLGGGSAYTLWAADSPIDMAPVGLATGPEFAPDATTATIAITVFNADSVPPPIAAGAIVPASNEFGELVYVASARQEGSDLTDATGMAGTLTVRDVGEQLCVEVDYRDDQKHLSGVVGAAAVSLS